MYICCAFTWPKIHICIKYIHVNANIHLVWAGVYLHGGVYLYMCKLTFTYMQLRPHAQKYTRVQIILMCIIYTPCVNLRMWTGLKIIDSFTCGGQLNTHVCVLPIFNVEDSCLCNNKACHIKIVNNEKCIFEWTISYTHQGSNAYQNCDCSMNREMSDMQSNKTCLKT